MRNLFMTEMIIEFNYSDADMHQADFRWRSWDVSYKKREK